MGHGPDNKSYYHEMFLRGRPDLAQLIPRVTASSTKNVHNQMNEPDFDEISKNFPLPEVDSHLGSDTYRRVLPRRDINDRKPYTKRQRQGQYYDSLSDEESSYSRPAPPNGFAYHGYQSGYGPYHAQYPFHLYYNQHTGSYDKPNTHKYSGNFTNQEQYYHQHHEGQHCYDMGKHDRARIGRHEHNHDRFLDTKHYYQDQYPYGMGAHTMETRSQSHVLDEEDTYCPTPTDRDQLNYTRHICPTLSDQDLFVGSAASDKHKHSSNQISPNKCVPSLDSTFQRSRGARVEYEKSVDETFNAQGDFNAGAHAETLNPAWINTGSYASQQQWSEQHAILDEWKPATNSTPNSSTNNSTAGSTKSSINPSLNWNLY